IGSFHPFNGQCLPIHDRLSITRFPITGFVMPIEFYSFIHRKTFFIKKMDNVLPTLWPFVIVRLFGFVYSRYQCLSINGTVPVHNRYVYGMGLVRKLFHFGIVPSQDWSITCPQMGHLDLTALVGVIGREI